jgi:hypothetical protein
LEVEVLADTPLYLLPTLQASSTASTNNYNTLNDLRQAHPSNHYEHHTPQGLFL